MNPSLQPYTPTCCADTCAVQAAAAWANLDSTDQSDWCYQQLRKHLCSVAAAGANDGLQLETRRALQRLQFSILIGNLSLAARQGQQVRLCCSVVLVTPWTTCWVVLTTEQEN